MFPDRARSWQRPQGPHAARVRFPACRAGRAESWSHEEVLVACLQREVAARESHGGADRIRAARFPARKSLEQFDHARGLKRDLIAGAPIDFTSRRMRGIASLVVFEDHWSGLIVLPGR